MATIGVGYKPLSPSAVILIAKERERRCRLIFSHAVGVPLNFRGPSISEAYQLVVQAGEAKAKLPARKIFLMGILAGAYIGFGAFLALSCGLNCPQLAATNPGLQKFFTGLVGLPFGLILCLVCGAELFTGNTAVVGAAWAEGRATAGQLAKSWAVSYAGNLVGSLLLVALVAGTGLLATAAAPPVVAAAKVSLPFHQAFFRGVVCNWLVCLAVYQATAASDLCGKFVGLAIPVTIFIATGLEHSVANMFLVPMGMAVGGAVTASQFLLHNLLPVTLGNVVGGAVLVAGAYSLVYGRRGS